MALQQDVCLRHGVVEFGFVDLVHEVLLEQLEQVVVPVSDGDELELTRLRQDFQDVLHLALGVQVLREELDRVRLDVIIGGDVPEIQGQQVHLLFDGDALVLLQLFRGELDEFGEVVVHVLPRDLY